MNENIDLTKILKDCPVGTEFYHVVYGRVWLTGVCLDDDCPIRLSMHNGPYTNTTLTKKGTFSKTMAGSASYSPAKINEIGLSSRLNCSRSLIQNIKSFDKVLVRDTCAYSWRCTLYSHTKEMVVHLDT